MPQEDVTASTVLGTGAVLAWQPGSDALSSQATTTEALVCRSDIPFAPSDRYDWAIATVFARAADLDVLIVLAQKTNSGDFAAGYAVGVLKGLLDSVTQAVHAIYDLVSAAFSFYLAIYEFVSNDVDFLLAVAQALSARDGEGINLEPIAQYLAQTCPELLDVLAALPPALANVIAYGATLTDDAVMTPFVWTKGEFARSELAVLAAPIVGDLLKEKLAAFAEKTPFDLGEALGKATGGIAIQTVLILIGLFVPEAVAGVEIAEVGVAIDDVGVAVETANDASGAVSVLERIPGITVIRNAVAKLGATPEALYAKTRVIRPHKLNKRLCGEFSKKLAAWYTRNNLSPEWVLESLESHHILKESFLDADKYPALTKEFVDVFGWKSTRDMDSVPVHELFHTRSPSRFAKHAATKTLKGAEREISFSKTLDNSITNWEKKNGAITNLRQLVEAHEEFYSSAGPGRAPFTELLWDAPMSAPEPELVPNWWLQDRARITSVQTWFIEVKALLTKLGK